MYFFTFDRKTVIKSSLEEDNVKQEEEIKELELIIQELKDINEKKGYYGSRTTAKK